ncbi:hypothetical protein DFP72DRAFT_1066689 [Ephemerocybe angulata]|uniref:Uncharacterized protein n=1 Tax=Ephemerocybe angulata TaxID=980116 RepID=A0A8H6M9S1_9AGAR|nr:hypothetical protein DFP72DRAFT_1066689 [Tulosesus angulatus]
MQFFSTRVISIVVVAFAAMTSVTAAPVPAPAPGQVEAGADGVMLRMLYKRYCSMAGRRMPACI